MRLLRRLLIVPALVALLAGCNPSLTPPANRRSDPSLVSAAALAQCPATGEPVNGGLPKVTLRCLGDGPSVDVAGLRGPAVVNAWYSSCAPCGTEAGFLAQFDQAARGRVLVLGVDSEAFPDDGLSFVRGHNQHYAQLTDQHSTLTSKVPIGEFPQTYFVDAAGQLAGPPMGPITSLQQLKDAVRDRLGVTVP